MTADPLAPPLSLWASCVGGCEEPAAAELAELGWDPLAVDRRTDTPTGNLARLQWEQGAVYGRASLTVLARTLTWARTITRANLLLATARVATLDDVERTVRGLDLDFLPDAPFAVRPRRTGTHDFRSPDIGEVVGAAVIDEHRAATGRRLPVDLDEPTVELRVEVAHDRLRVGLDLTGGSLHRRPYLPYRHRAGLNPTVAAALVRLAGWRPDERLLDPFVGGATIPIEAAGGVAGLPVRRRLPPRLPALGLEVGAPAQRRRGVRGLHLAGVDRSTTALEGARRNLAATELGDAVTLHRGEATTLDGVGTADVVVTNPPYGIRSGRHGRIPELYARALGAIADHLAAGGRVLALTTRPGPWVDAAEAAGLVVRGQRRVVVGNLTATAVSCGTGDRE